MKRVVKDDVAPAGFERVWLDSGTALLVPRAIAESRAQENLKRREEEEDRRREELRQQQDERVAQAKRERQTDAAQAGRGRKAARAQPKVGWHRVLPRFAEIAKQVDDPNAMERSADVDANKRKRRIFEKLLELGPDRRIAIPNRWQEALDELEATLPHFRAPVRSVRHALALAQATGTPPRIAPQLLLGPPGVGKTFFSHRVAELFGTTHASVQFDQPSGGAQLRGSDKYWANTEAGLLFNSICLGEFANPVVLLDEMDKACSGASHKQLDPLAQLHGALERETAQRLIDVSVDVEFDASLAVYIGTANSLRGLEAPIVSRMQVFVIEPPSKWEAVDIATTISGSVLRRLGLEGQVDFERQALYLLAHLSPRLMARAAEQSVAAAVASGRRHVGEAEVWNELGGADQSALH